MNHQFNTLRQFIGPELLTQFSPGNSCLSNVKKWCNDNKLKASADINFFKLRFDFPHTINDYIIAIAPLLQNKCDDTYDILCETHGDVFHNLELIWKSSDEPIKWVTFKRKINKVWGVLALRHDEYDGSDIVNIYPINDIDNNYIMPLNIDHNMMYILYDQLSSISIIEHIKLLFRHKHGFCDVFNVPVCSKHYGGRVEANRISWDESNENIKGIIEESKQNFGLLTYLMNMANSKNSCDVLSNPWCDILKNYICQSNNLVSILNLPYPLIFMMKNTKNLNFYVSRSSKGSLITVTLPLNNAETTCISTELKENGDSFSFTNIRNQWKWL